MENLASAVILPHMGNKTANRIREWRHLRRLSQEELAERVGSTGQTIGRYESGQRQVTLKCLARLAEALDCEPADLLPNSAASIDRETYRFIEDFLKLPEAERHAVANMVRARARGGN
jgi:transcriptional regulator with XRE-family HTH domain